MSLDGVTGHWTENMLLLALATVNIVRCNALCSLPFASVFFFFFCFSVVYIYIYISYFWLISFLCIITLFLSISDISFVSTVPSFSALPMIYVRSITEHGAHSATDALRLTMRGALRRRREGTTCLHVCRARRGRWSTISRACFGRP